MKQSRFSEEQIIGILREQETGISQRELMHVAVRAWFDIPDRFRPGDANPYPCGSVQPLDVVIAHLAGRRAA